MGEVGGGARRRQNPACRGRVAGGCQVLRRLSPLPGGGALGSRPNALRSVRGPGVLCWFFLGFLRDGRSQHVFVPGGRKQSLSEGPFKSCVSSCREGGWGDTRKGRSAALLLHPAPGRGGFGAGSWRCGRGGRGGLPVVLGPIATSFSWVPFALAPGGKCQGMGWKFASAARFRAVHPGDHGDGFCVPRLHLWANV